MTASSRRSTTGDGGGSASAGSGQTDATKIGEEAFRAGSGRTCVQKCVQKAPKRRKKQHVAEQEGLKTQ